MSRSVLGQAIMLAAALFASDAGAFSKRGAAKVRPGMSETEVVRAVGPPDARLHWNGRRLLLWAEERKDLLGRRAKPKVMALEFSEDGRLTAPITQAVLPKD
jgi:hypothetical protein